MMMGVPHSLERRSMMEQTATFSKSSSLGEYAALMAMTASGRENIFREKSLQHIQLLPLTTGAYGTTANALANATYASQFIVFQGFTKGAENTTGMSSSFDIFSGLFGRNWIFPNMQPIFELVGKLTWPTPVEETSFRTHYELVPKRTIAELARAYEARMARLPHKRYVDIDLPMMDDGGDW